MRQTIAKYKVFVDTNVLIDYLIPSRPFHQVAKDLFGLIFSSRVEAAVSTQSILDAGYVVRKNPGFSREAFRSTVLYMMSRINVDSIGYFDIKDAMKDPHEDLEDNAQVAFAYSQACDFLITNDKTFLAREVPRPMQVMTPQDFVNRCRA